MRELLPAPTAHAWSQLSEISGRISGLAGYRISGNAYPVSGRIPDIKKWPDIRHIPTVYHTFLTYCGLASDELVTRRKPISVRFLLEVKNALVLPLFIKQELNFAHHVLHLLSLLGIFYFQPFVYVVILGLIF